MRGNLCCDVTPTNPERRRTVSASPRERWRRTRLPPCRLRRGKQVLRSGRNGIPIARALATGSCPPALRLLVFAQLLELDPADDARNPTTALFDIRKHSHVEMDYEEDDEKIHQPVVNQSERLVSHEFI
jgi:hypothetical protein